LMIDGPMIEGFRTNGFKTNGVKIERAMLDRTMFKRTTIERTTTEEAIYGIQTEELQIRQKPEGCHRACDHKVGIIKHDDLPVQSVSAANS
jgi:hypothetical protein